MLAWYFLNGSPPSEINTLSLHDALPIFIAAISGAEGRPARPAEAVRTARPASEGATPAGPFGPPDRKSTRLNSSHQISSYADFSLQEKAFQLLGRSGGQLPVVMLGRLSG